MHGNSRFEGGQTMDAVTLIQNDHRLLESLFDKLRSGQGNRQVLLVEVAARLAAHSHAEEMKVYSALTEAEPDERNQVEHGAQEHHEAEQMLHRLMAMEPNDSKFESELTRFVEAVLEHVQEEENEVLPALQRAVDADRLEELGQAFEEVRTKELEIAGISADASAGGGGGGGTPTSEMSRAELYEQAKEAGVPGRSNMTKEELAQALRDEGQA
jgi:hemerythrin superfamily protein